MGRKRRLAKRYLCGAYLQLNKFPEAQVELLAALAEAEELGVMPVTLEVLLSWAVLDASQGQVEQSREIASLIVNHPFSEYSTRNAASQLLNQLKLTSTELLDDPVRCDC